MTRYFGKAAACLWSIGGISSVVPRHVFLCVLVRKKRWLFDFRLPSALSFSECFHSTFPFASSHLHLFFPFWQVWSLYRAFRTGTLALSVLTALELQTSCSSYLVSIYALSPLLFPRETGHLPYFICIMPSAGGSSFLLWWFFIKSSTRELFFSFSRLSPVVPPSFLLSNILSFFHTLFWVSHLSSHKHSWKSHDNYCVHQQIHQH